MRIVAGTAGGRRILTPEGGEVRPTSERVREAIFNSLVSHGLIEGARAIDLFAGSGALGLEALSRGAAHVTFVDSGRASIRCVRANVEALGFGDRATARTGDALEHARAAGRFDLALVDPPYAFDRWGDLLDAIDAQTLVIESDRPIDAGPRRRILKQKQYAGTVVTIATSDRTVDDDASNLEQEAPPA